MSGLTTLVRLCQDIDQHGPGRPAGSSASKGHRLSLGPRLSLSTLPSCVPEAAIRMIHRKEQTAATSPSRIHRNILPANEAGTSYYWGTTAGRTSTEQDQDPVEPRDQKSR